MTDPTPEPTTSIWSRLPSIVWIILVVGGIIGVIAGFIGLFYALSHIEGFASILMLLVAWGIIRFFAGNPTASPPVNVPPLIKAVAIVFFACMGMAIDQTGNIVYNQPIEWLFCPSETTLERGVSVTHPLPGRTDVTQEFSCVATVNGQPEVVDQPGVLAVIATRFVEYVLIGYALVALNRVYNAIRVRRSAVPA
ncbi:MAG: hypothetical protein JXQ72_11935 [Anaerolineae bacterium]|nr:hypothetical protein [Anaerolineae bacterium]